MTIDVAGDDEANREYRVVRRRRGTDDSWQNVITRRGLGRPFNSLPAARGVLTRESKFPWNREYEYKVQWRPVVTKWWDVES